MTKTSIKMTTPAVTAIQPSAPWACHHHDAGANIDAFIEACKEWQTIAKTETSPAFDAHAVAEYIVSTINAQEDCLSLMEEMASALEACLEGDRLNWTAEHDGEIILDRYRGLLKGQRS